MPNGERYRKKDSARLVWDSKPRRAPNPRDIEFQTAEVVIPNWVRDSGQIPISFRDSLFGEKELDKQQVNRLIWGDNLLAMQALLAQGYEGKIKLIFIDPPFSTDEDYSYLYNVGEEVEVNKSPSIIERLAYKNTWSGGLDTYLDFIYPRLSLMKRLMADDGMIFVRYDYHVGNYIKIVLDEVFGRENFQNELVVNRIKKGVTFQGRRSMPVATDALYVYFKSDKTTFANIEKEREQIRPGFWRHRDDSSGIRHPRERDFFGKTMLPPAGKHWKFSQERIDRMIDEGKLRLNPETGRPEYWVEKSSYTPLDSNWTDIPGYSFTTGYPTENSLPLLERVLTVGSGKGHLVADFFSGSGTALVAAERLGRRWIGCDLSKVAIQVTRTRLVQQDAKPFLIENIGNYQREMIYLSGGRIGEMQQIILRLYGATPRKDSADLGTRHSPEDGMLELVYVGYPDRPVTARKAEELARQAEKLDGTGYKRLIILAWDYDYNYSSELENRLKATKQPLKTKIESRTIPPDIYEYLKKAKDEEDIEPLRGKIKFYEKPYLRLTMPQVTPATQGKAEVTIGIERYVVFDLPVAQKEREKLQELIKDNFAILIDYWAVDWDYDGYTFKSQWQDMRGNGRKTKVVTIQASASMATGKTYTVAVRLVDIFGNDAAGTLKVEL